MVECVIVPWLEQNAELLSLEVQVILKPVVLFLGGFLCVSLEQVTYESVPQMSILQLATLTLASRLTSTVQMGILRATAVS